MVEGPSWEEYRIHLASELNRMASVIEKLADRVDAIDKTMIANGAIASQNSRIAGAVWGGVSALCVALGGWILQKVFGHP